MAKKIALEQLTNKIAAAAANAPGGGSEAVDRFARAESVLAAQPTGFGPPASSQHTFTRESDNPKTRPDVADTFTRESVGSKGRYFKSVPIDLVDPNPFNARKIYKPERVNEMGESMKATGQLQPGVATIRNGRYVLAAAHYRWRGIKVANLPSMDLMVHEGLTDQQLYEISYKENQEREDQTPIDNALCWQDLVKQGLYPNESAIAEATGVSLSNVNKTMSILRLPDSVLDLIRQQPEKYPLSALYELVLLGGVAEEKETLSMAEKLRDGEIGRKEINELRARLETHKTRKRKEVSRQYKILADDGSESLGVLKEWDNGKVALEVHLLDPRRREAVVANIKRLFSLADS